MRPCRRPIGVARSRMGAGAPPAAEAAAIAPSSPAQVRYKDRRLMVLFFDFSSMPQAEQLRAQEAALKFLSRR